MAFADQSIAMEGFRVGELYSRDEIAIGGSVRRPIGSRDPNWSSGIVSFANAILLLVTLDKSNKQDYAYEDRFEESMFWWQSQNAQTQQSPAIRRILMENTSVLLFARITDKRKGKTCRFVYCGRLTDPIAEAERPVTVLFQNPDYQPAATGDLRSIYEWRPAKVPDPREVQREARVRTRAPAVTGQGRQLDPRTRKEIELHAMRAALVHYEHGGYTLADTSRNRPYDYVATRGSETRRIEVKGTQGDGSSVILTANEVAAVRSGPEPTDLFVLADIGVDLVNGAPVASGGSKRVISNWQPETSDLTATEYRYALPGE